MACIFFYSFFTSAAAYIAERPLFLDSFFSSGIAACLPFFLLSNEIRIPRKKESSTTYRQEWLMMAHTVSEICILHFEKITEFTHDKLINLLCGHEIGINNHAS